MQLSEETLPEQTPVVIPTFSLGLGFERGQTTDTSPEKSPALQEEELIPLPEERASRYVAVKNITEKLNSKVKFEENFKDKFLQKPSQIIREVAEKEDLFVLEADGIYTRRSSILTKKGIVPRYDDFGSVCNQITASVLNNNRLWPEFFEIHPEKSRDPEFMHLLITHFYLPKTVRAHPFKHEIFANDENYPHGKHGRNIRQALDLIDLTAEEDRIELFRHMYSGLKHPVNRNGVSIESFGFSEEAWGKALRIIINRGIGILHDIIHTTSRCRTDDWENTVCEAILSGMEDFIDPNHPEFKEIVSHLKSSPTNLSSTFGCEIPLINRAEKGILRIAQYAESAEQLKSWEEQIAVMPNRNYYEIICNCILPLETAGWIHNATDIDKALFLASKTIADTEREACYNVANILESGDWETALSFAESGCCYEGPLLAKYETLSHLERVEWSANKKYFHYLFNGESHIDWPNEPGRRMARINHIFESMSAFESQACWDFILSSGRGVSSDQEKAVHQIYHYYENGRISELTDFVREFGFIEYEAFHYYQKNGSLPEGLERFIDLRHEWIEKAESSTSDAFIARNLLARSLYDKIWKSLTAEEGISEEAMEKLIEDIFEIIEFIYICEPVFGDRSFNDYDHLSLSGYIGKDLDAGAFLEAVSKVQNPKFEKWKFREYLRIFARAETQAEAVTKMQANTIVGTFDHDGVSWPGFNRPANAENLAERYLTDPALQSKFSSAVELLTVAKPLINVCDFHEIQDVVDFVSAGSRINPDDVETVTGILPKDTFYGIRTIINFGKLDQAGKDKWKKRYEHCKELFEACVPCALSMPPRPFIQITEFLKTDPEIRIETFRQLKKTLPKQSLSAEFIINYLKLDSENQVAVVREINNQKRAVLARTESVITEGNVVCTSVLAVLKRITVDQFIDGIRQGGTETITPVPETFRTRKSIEVTEKEAIDLTVSENSLCEKIMMRLIREAISEGPNDIYIALDEAIKKSLKGMGENGFSESPNYKALEAFNQAMSQIDDNDPNGEEKEIMALGMCAHVLGDKVIAPFLCKVLMTRVFEESPHLENFFSEAIIDVEDKREDINTKKPVTFDEYFSGIQEVCSEMEQACQSLFDSPHEEIRNTFAGLVPETYSASNLYKSVTRYLRISILDAAAARSERIKTKPKKSTLHIIGSPKNEIDSFYAKDTCVSKYTAEIGNPNFIPLRILNEDESDLLGFIWCLEEDHDELGKILVLSDIQPNTEVRGKFISSELYGKILETLQAYAQEGGYTAILQTTARGTQSNDVELAKHMRRHATDLDDVKLSQIRQFPRKSGTDISECKLLFRIE